ncbi:aspartate/glutamate racemase family protein [Arthrobacter sp. NPDC056493]|uniref:aspartate/glutamate racemase family protein n=1 Tax=Arthrobacter sp. NPDC056493 TaxID=3345839 RepID=UPI00366C6979
MEMRRIGLIGGMSFEGSAVYYRMLNEAVRERLGGLNSAEVLLHSVNFQEIVALQKAGRWEDAGRSLAQVARGLEAAGADCVMICAVTMHLVADAVEESVGVPMINIIDETAFGSRPPAPIGPSCLLPATPWNTAFTPSG